MKYTYVVDHGRSRPRVSAATEVNGGKLVDLMFDDALKRLDETEQKLAAALDCLNEIQALDARADQDTVAEVIARYEDDWS